MSILAIGSEIVECLRIGRMIERHGELFLTRVYTAREMSWCHARRHVTECFAERWAAKRAVLKCLGATSGRRLWTDVEIRVSPEGTPSVYVSGLAKERAALLRVNDIMLTLAHCRAYATATAIAVR